MARHDHLDQMQEASRRGTAVCVGVFDGVHRGHQMLIDRARRKADQAGLAAVVLTFRTHPLQLLAPPYAPRMLTCAEEKAGLIERYGAEHCLMLDFTPEFSRIPAIDFIDDILVRRLNARHLVCGEDFRFGHEGRGDVEMLQKKAREHGMGLEVCPALRLDGGPVKSTRVRQALLEGHIEEANRLLGRAYTLPGVVVEGDRRGRQIGYPTANLEPPPERLVPGNGVYAVRVTEGERQWGAMMNIGVRPTFQREQLAVEAHLFDFEGDLYGRRLTVHFLSRVREERRFPSIGELVKQIQADELTCRDLIQGATGG